MNKSPDNPLIKEPAPIDLQSISSGRSPAPNAHTPDSHLGIFDIATTIQQLCSEVTLNVAHVSQVNSQLCQVDSQPITTSGKKSNPVAPVQVEAVKSPSEKLAGLPELDILSSEFLQSIAQFISKTTRRPTGIVMVAKSGNILQIADSGFKETLTNSKSIVQRIAKECSLKPSIRASSEYVGKREGFVGSVNLNRLSDRLESQLLAIPSKLEHSQGMVVCLMGSPKLTPENDRPTEIQVANWFLTKPIHEILVRSMDAWMQLRRSSRWLTVLSAIDWIKSRPRWWLVPITVSALFLWIPVPYYPKRDCIIEPESKQYLASPIQGRIASCDVRPGDPVEAGQLLAKLDDSDLQRDLASANAEFDAANKKYDSAIVTRATGNAGLAEIEKQQAQRRIANITDQLKRLEIRALSPGVVVQGDWIRSVGMPVTLGQNLFEVAMLETMTAELQLFASDLGHIQVGDAVSVRSDADGGASFTGKISRIEPRATVKDDKAVFIADVIVRDPKMNLRPGMKATAHIQAGWKSIGWLLFDRPYRWLANQWIW